MSVVYKKLEEVCEILDSQRVPITAKDRKSGIYPYYGANGLQDHVSDYIFDDELVLLAEDGGNFGSKDRPIAYRVSGKCWVNNHAHVLKAKSNIHIDYLCYALMFYNTDGLVNGATRQKLTQAAMRQMVIPYRCMKEQEQIVDEISRVFHLIAVHNEELALLDQLVKSRFIELFGDIKTGDYKFETRKLGEVAEVGSSHRVFTTEFVEEGVPFYRGTEIGELANGLKPENPYRITKEHYDRLACDKTKPKLGDLLMPSICNKGQVWMVDTDEPFYYKDGRVLCISPNRKLFNCKYLEQFMREKTLVEYPKLGSGSTFAEFKIFLLKDIEVLIPPIELQDQFAAFVEQTDKSKYYACQTLVNLLKLSNKTQFWGNSMNVDVLKHDFCKVADNKSVAERVKDYRNILIDAIDYIYESKKIHKPEKASLLEIVDGDVLAEYVNDADVINALHYVRILGMNAEHNQPIKKSAEKLAYDNLEYFIGLIDAQEKGVRDSYQKPQYMSEATTRKLYIDLYLNEAGWEILDKENVALAEKAGIEIKVDGMPNAQGIGFCDYVLYGRDGKPLAIVEAKKTSVSPEKGRHQVDLYGECMKKVYGYKPVLYYTNGYETKIIDGIYPDRKVMAFHTIDELELMLQRRDRGDITDLKINDEITNRPYQKMAITNMCERLNQKHRRGLLVMATGTGKTRVAISLVDVLSRNNWVKNVLFLADRTSLVTQAKKSFSKLLPNMSICELSGNEEKDYNARLMFCTYQTMINYIDAEDKRFTSGRFDLIIIDEAHRSIFNKYGSIFNYYDSLLVGLTATPKSEVDANTYRIFGCESGVPNFDYSLEEAVKDKYLVNYKSFSRTTKLLKRGIKYSELTEDEKRQLDDYFVDFPPTPDFTVSEKELFRKIFNKNTCCEILEELMQYGIKTNCGEKIGKTIIFAYNHHHAQMIVDCFQELFPEYPANYCQLIDNYVKYADDLVLKFGSDDEFRIAVSVDMLDTGIDVPAVVNLVFFKPVKSKIKFVQMIGRGTRLCENLFGEGKHKTHFVIFDYCGNFEYFDTHPEGTDGIISRTLSQRLFEVRVDIVHELQRFEYQEQEFARNYYLQTREILQETVRKIKSHSSRMQIRAQMQYVDKYCDCKNWEALSPIMVKEIKTHLSSLLDSGLDGFELSVAFDVRMLYIELSLLVQGNTLNAARDVKTVRQVAQYLLVEKASIPQVFAKAEQLKTLVSDQFWGNPSVEQLEYLRIEVRDLMRFIESKGPKPIDVDIDDTVEPSGYDGNGGIIDIRTYREKVIDYLIEHSDSEVIHKIQRLEKITNQDLKELERILWEELGTKEDYENTTDIDNIAVFVRSLIGLSQEAVNEKFGEYLNGSLLNSQQQEFLKSIINYVRENGDIKREDLIEKSPFDNFDILDLFGENIKSVLTIIEILHDSVNVVA